MANFAQKTSVAHFTNDNFEQEVLQSSQPVLVDFYADWCGPCRMLAPAVENVARLVGTDAKVGKLNIDENPQAAAAYGISSIPAVLVFKDGKVVDTLVGVQPEQRYVEALQQTTT